MVHTLVKNSGIYPLVSIILVNYNGRKFLNRCLTTLLDTDYPNYEIIIIDNFSSDGSLKDLKESFGSNPLIKIIENTGNLGHSEGCNIGTKTTKGQYLVFIDSDIEFGATNWLSELVKTMENNSSIGLAQAKILLAENKNRLDYVCLSIDALGTWSTTYGKLEKSYNKNIPIMAASSGCCIIRRDVFNQVDGFDADYFIYDDDTDLSFRSRLLGYNVMFVPSSKVIHRSGLLRGVSGFMLFHSSKNRLNTVIKNFELKNVWWRFFVLTFFMFLVSAGFFVTKQHREAKSTIKGTLNPIFSFPKIWKKRLSIQSKRFVRDSDMIKSGLIRNDFWSTIQDFKLKIKQMF